MRSLSYWSHKTLKPNMSLLEILPSRVVSAAEEKHRERQVLLEELFPRISGK